MRVLFKMVKENVVDIKVLVATHKEYQMPADTVYVPVFVGNAIHPENNPGFQGDDEGENISLKNKNYNELTAIYWAWKNLDADAVGLVHYRRYLVNNTKKGTKFDKLLSESELQNLLIKSDVVLPKKRNYYIESNYSHYIHAHHEEPLKLTKKVLENSYPRYVESYDKIMNRKSAHMFNMFVMKKEYFDSYCEWMFDVLGKVENQLDISTYDAYEARVYGFISELMLDIWLDTNKIKSTEVPFKFMEKQNWLVKGFCFMKRKYFGKI